jgi:hypothetical protein
MRGSSIGIHRSVTIDETPTLFPYIDCEVVIRISAGGKRSKSYPGFGAVALCTLESPFAAQNRNGPLEQGFGSLDRRFSDYLDSENRAVSQGKVMVNRKVASSLHVVGSRSEINGSDCTV